MAGLLNRRLEGDRDFRTVTPVSTQAGSGLFDLKIKPRIHTDKHGDCLIDALSVFIRMYPWLDLSSFGVARIHSS